MVFQGVDSGMAWEVREQATPVSIWETVSSEVGQEEWKERDGKEDFNRSCYSLNETEDMIVYWYISILPLIGVQSSWVLDASYFYQPSCDSFFLCLLVATF